MPVHWRLTSSMRASPDEKRRGRTPSRRRVAPRIVLFVDGGDWHAKRLARAFEEAGAELVQLSLKACAFDTRVKGGLDMPGLDGRLPDGVFVRTIGSGTFEQVTLRLGLLHALQAAGVLVWNEARAIERCVDKSTATYLFGRAGVPTPPTRTVEGRSRAAAYTKAARQQLVVKPLFGAQGKGLARVGSATDLPASEAVAGVYYLQEFVPREAETFEDWRVLVSGRRVVASMRRRSNGWITNVHQGGEALPHEADAEMADLAIRAASATGAAYAGVDLVRDADGRLLVLEANSMPAWRGLQSVTKVDIAAALVADFLAAVARRVAP